jgi:hypothetical protein
MDNNQTTLQWQNTFAMLPLEDSVAKDLPGDKILLPQSALEQLLSSANSQAASQSLAADGTQLGGVNALPNPLMFHITNPTTKATAYAGIREFSAPEGTIAMSPYLVEALGIPGDDGSKQVTAEDRSLVEPSHLIVRAAQLPKGTYARMRPLEAGYNPDDWRPLLERQLTQSFTSLTKDAMLLVKGVQGETFRLLVDKIEPEGQGICVVDTDLEVDIEALNEDQARETMRRIMTRGKESVSNGSAHGGTIDVWTPAHGQAVPGQYVDYFLPSWDRNQHLYISLFDLADTDELDLFVSPKSGQQRALPRKSEHLFGDFGPARDGSKTISISPTNVELEGAEGIMISVHAFEASVSTAGKPVQFTVRASFTNPNQQPASSKQESASSDEEQCRNCMRYIPKQSVVLHESFCRRNNVICPRCNSVFKKDSEEFQLHWHCDYDDAYGNTAQSKTKHDTVFHSDWHCPSCAFTTNSLPDLARHRTSICPGKIILCRFCHLEVPQEGDPLNPSPEVLMSGLTAHELADGARTTECHLCDKIVRLRDMDTHLKHHELDKASKARPPICRNSLCGRTLHGMGSKGHVNTGPRDGSGSQNEVGLCSICFGPLYVSMHDPDGKALRRRIERRYLGQMMTGCGKEHCQNEWCKTGRANSGLEAKGSSAKDALPLVKPLMAAVPNVNEPMFFCVDEANQTRRKLAQLLAAEKVYDLEWCVAAAEAEKGNLDRMREWLQAWAPKRSST